jgi:hypothetical protein
VEIHVRPAASAAAVGGDFDGALVVRVVERPDAGKATEAALRAVAEAVGVPRRCVSLVRGATSRRKLVEIDAPAEDAARVADVLERLRAAGG